MTTDRYYYVSLPFYNHRQMKCAGRCPDKAHEDFYLPYFQQWGHGGELDGKPGKYDVVIVEGYRGNLIPNPRFDEDNPA